MGEILMLDNKIKQKNVLLIIANIISIIFCLLCLILVVIYLINGDKNNRVLPCIGMAICYILPVLLRCFKIFLPNSLVVIYLLFITIGGFLGSCLSLYYKIPALDIIVHSLWGYVVCVLAIYLLCKIKKDALNGTLFLVLFVFSFSMATASMWELIEFFSDAVLGQTSQGVPINGVVSVSDTMIDILCHFCGTVLFLLQYLIEKLTKRNLGIGWMISDFNNK